MGKQQPQSERTGRVEVRGSQTGKQGAQLEGITAVYSRGGRLLAVGPLHKARADLAHIVWAGDAVIIDDIIFVPKDGACVGSAGQTHWST